MKNRIALLLGCLSLTLVLPMAAASAAANGPLAPNSTAKGSTGKLTMAEKASFHKVHSRPVLKLVCDDCHLKAGLADNVLNARQNDKLAKKDPGPVDHETCFDCHRRASKPLPYFAKKEQ
jgi:hypothetical protein